MNTLPKNFVVIDLETTGLDASACAILEIGAAMGSGRSFYRRCAIERGRRVDWPALQCNGIDPLDLGLGVSIESALCDLFRWLDGGNTRWIMGGKNPQFDYGFLEANWPTGSVGVLLREVISRRCVDLHSLAYGHAMREGIDMAADGFTTDQIYSTLGMDKEPMPHNALRGALHELEGFRRLLLDDAEHDTNPYFEKAMETADRAWVQSANEPHMDHGNQVGGPLA